jgi:probable DNA metabolism protein
VICLDCDGLFSQWRQQARWLLSHQVDPCEVSWNGEREADLFSGPHSLPDALGPHRSKIPAALPELLQSAAQYLGEHRWSLLYEVLWRVSHGDRTAMLAGDALGSELHRRVKQVSREAHHLHAFLRFVERPSPGEGPAFVAWHEPAHDILEQASVHFVGRMGRERWLIATPRDGVFYDGRTLHHERRCPPAWRELARGRGDDTHALWKAYYAHTFNPARINPSIMQGHMPTRFWKLLPEGDLIPKLVVQARHGKQRDGQAAAVAALPGKAIGARVKGAVPSVDIQGMDPID